MTNQPRSQGLLFFPPRGGGRKIRDLGNEVDDEGIFASTVDGNVMGGNTSIS